MTWKICSYPGCGELVKLGRCAKHPYQRSRIPQPRSRAERRRRREAVLAHPWCAACGSTQDLTADHVIPISAGGLNGPLQVLCRSCNSRKGARVRRASPR